MRNSGFFLSMFLIFKNFYLFRERVRESAQVLLWEGGPEGIFKQAPHWVQSLGLYLRALSEDSETITQAKIKSQVLN